MHESCTTPRSPTCTTRRTLLHAPDNSVEISTHESRIAPACRLHTDLHGSPTP